MPMTTWKTFHDPRIRAISRTLALTLLAGGLLAGCGKSDEEQAAEVKQAEDAAASQAAQAVTDATDAEAKKYAHMANAVVTSKSTAPIDLKYDLPTKPDVAQPFEIELTFQPRVQADVLELEFTDMPGLVLVGARNAKFDKVVPGEAYSTRVLVRADAPGLFYVSVVAKMVTQVQTEARAFSIPVVVGTAPATSQKAAPEKDASGQPIESMPAQES
jgi:hypothetical protein